jgi:hypothetical protein
MLNKLTNAIWLSLGAIGALWLLTSLAGVVQGGDLDPPATPGSTMQTLDDLPPAWHKEISGAARFDDSTAQAQGYVLDRETGLVWEKTPDTTTRDWDSSVEHCYNRTVGGEIGQSMGWRLPTIDELFTLVEPMTVGTPKLPAGHPFSGIAGEYWTATTRPAPNVSDAYSWDSDTAAVSTWNKVATRRAWCVRAPSGYDNVGAS